jgi:hypothetical protein
VVLLSSFLLASSEESLQVLLVHVLHGAVVDRSVRHFEVKALARSELLFEGLCLPVQSDLREE